MGVEQDMRDSHTGPKKAVAKRSQNTRAGETCQFPGHMIDSAVHISLDPL